jgi:hypothetical protein
VFWEREERETKRQKVWEEDIYKPLEVEDVDKTSRTDQFNNTGIFYNLAHRFNEKFKCKAIFCFYSRKFQKLMLKTQIVDAWII